MLNRERYSSLHSWEFLTSTPWGPENNSTPQISGLEIPVRATSDRRMSFLYKVLLYTLPQNSTYCGLYFSCVYIQVREIWVRKKCSGKNTRQGLRSCILNLLLLTWLFDLQQVIIPTGMFWIIGCWNSREHKILCLSSCIRPNLVPLQGLVTCLMEGLTTLSPLYLTIHPLLGWGLATAALTPRSNL